MNYVEKNCTIEHNGRKFTAGGAVVTPEHLVGYLGKPRADGSRFLENWHGKWLGTCWITSTWRTSRSFTSGTMHQVHARVNGVTYTGRSAGEGMLFRGRRVKREQE